MLIFVVLLSKSEAINLLENFVFENCGYIYIYIYIYCLKFQSVQGNIFYFFCFAIYTGWPLVLRSIKVYLKVYLKSLSKSLNLLYTLFEVMIDRDDYLEQSLFFWFPLKDFMRVKYHKLNLI